MSLLAYVLRLADGNLVLAQRLGEWVGHAPALEEDLGLANIALDHLGRARYLLDYAGRLEGRGRDEDALAFQRSEAEFSNYRMAEQPNGDFAHTIVRQVLMDALHLELFERLQHGSDACLAGIAAKAVKESRYHFRYSAGWLMRLGNGTPESRRRTECALGAMWPLTREFFDADHVDEDMHRAGIAPALAVVQAAWSERIGAALAQAKLPVPAAPIYSWYGKRGEHSEHLGRLLTELQSMYRAHDGTSW